MQSPEEQEMPNVVHFTRGTGLIMERTSNKSVLAKSGCASPSESYPI